MEVVKNEIFAIGFSIQQKDEQQSKFGVGVYPDWNYRRHGGYTRGHRGAAGTDFAYTKNKLIAVNLAQEGVELTRSVRDDNTLCDTINGAPVWPWNRDPQSGGTFVNFVGEISIDQTMNIDCGIGTYQGNPVVIKVPLLPPDGCINKLRLDTTTGIYGHNGDKETIFSRCVQIMVPPVCIDQDAPDATCPDSDVLLSDQMEIISTVIWSEKGRQNTAVLRERIYNWK